MLQKSFRNKNISKKIKISFKEHNKGQNFNICIRNLDNNRERERERERERINILARKVYRRILGPVHDDEKENWRILTNKEIYAMVKKPTITEKKG
jgi:hypothetical protein